MTLSLKLWSLNMAYTLIFLLKKNVSSFCICKSYSHFFFSKNTCELDIVLTRTVNILTTNELVKLTMLGTTGPRSAYASFAHKITVYRIISSKEWTATDLMRLNGYVSAIHYDCVLYMLNGTFSHNHGLYQISTNGFSINAVSKYLRVK